MPAPPDEQSEDLLAIQAKERVQFTKRSCDDPEKYDIPNEGCSYHWTTKQRRDAYADDQTGTFPDPNAKQSSQTLPSVHLENGYQPAEDPDVGVAGMEEPMTEDEIARLIEEEWCDVEAD